MSARIADHEVYLRAALHAAVDSLEPQGDGLERIRARLHQPRTASARLRVVYDEMLMRTPTWLQDVAYRVADWIRVVSDRFAPAQAPGKHRSRTQGLLRPLAAMAVVMFIVAAGTYVAIDASTAIFPSSSSNAPPGGSPNNGGHPGAAAASHLGGGGSAAGTASHTPAPSKSCRSATPQAGQTTSTAPPPAPSASPSASPADTSTDTSSPSPTDTDTTPAAPATPADSVAPSPNAPTTQTTTTPPMAKPSPGC